MGFSYFCVLIFFFINVQSIYKFVHPELINGVRVNSSIVNSSIVLRVVSWISMSSCYFLIFTVFRAWITSEFVSQFSFWTRVVEQSSFWKGWAQVLSIFTVLDSFYSWILLAIHFAEYPLLLPKCLAPK